MINDQLGNIIMIIILGALYSYSLIKFFKTKPHFFYPTVLLFILLLYCISLDKVPETDFPKFLINIISICLFIAITNEGIKTSNKTMISISIYSTAILIITRFFDLFRESLLKSGISFNKKGTNEKPMKNKNLTITLIIQLLIFTIVGLNLYINRVKYVKEFYLKTIPIDPRDYLSGT